MKTKKNINKTWNMKIYKYNIDLFDWFLFKLENSWDKNSVDKFLTKIFPSVQIEFRSLQQSHV